jgi:hypothetical protein
MTKSLLPYVRVRAMIGAVAAFLLAVIGAQAARAQNNNVGGFFGNRVGGVSIDAAGMVTPPASSTRIKMRDELRALHAAPTGELGKRVEMRMLSLRRLEEAVRAAGKSLAEEIPDDLRFLAGIQRIQYVLVYPEENDIVLAGPGEGWKVDEEGNVVGVTTGRPVLRLEDLLIALRTVDIARRGGISCSIDPTDEGRRRYEELMAKRGSGSISIAQLKRVFGDQQVTVSGVPADSRFARTLVSSDFHMKRIGMDLEPSPVKALPSYLDMLKRNPSAVEFAMPRWWMACDYEPLGRSEDGLAYEIRGRGVKCMAEDEVLDAAGKATGTGAANPLAQKWADLMTHHYEELSAKEPAFAELRNLMDMCVVAALISKERLLQRASCELPTLMSAESSLSYFKMDAPRSVETLCSSVKGGGATIVMTGGVSIASWQVADKIELRPAVAQAREKAKAEPSASQAWWNPAR